MICVMVLLIRYGKVFKSYVLGRYTVFMTGRAASKILLTGKDGIVSLTFSTQDSRYLDLLACSNRQERRTRNSED